jgi:hypothetical protein
MSPKPIFGTDLSKPLSALIEEWRAHLVQVRGQMSDAGHAWSGWGEQLDDIEGLITCGLVALYNIKQRAQECEAKWGADYLQKASEQKEQQNG